MKAKNFVKVIPWFPLIVMGFYLVLMFLWHFQIIPLPEEMIIFVEKMMAKVGVIGIFLAAFFEGLAFIGYQFPGISLIIISLIVSKSDFSLLASMAAIITLALTASSLVNYYVGTFFSRKNEKTEKQSTKTLFLSALHPNFLSLYFFHRGMRKKGLKELILVPVILFPYTFVITFIIYFFSDFIREELLTSDLFFLSVFVGWFLVELYLNLKKRERK